jgi:hypothetical protein
MPPEPLVQGMIPAFLCSSGLDWHDKWICPAIAAHKEIKNSRIDVNDSHIVINRIPHEAI